MASDEAMSGEVLTGTSGKVFTALASRSPATRSLPNVASPVAVSDRAAKALSSKTFHVDRLLSGDVLTAAREAAASLAHEHGQAAAVGDDDESKVDTSVWSSDALNLLNRELRAPGLAPLYRVIDELRVELARATGRTLTEDVELNLLCYHPGGHYVRHFDDVPSDAVDGGRRLRRSISILIYLTPQNWKEVDGGYLRIYPPAARPYADVPPTGGSCIIFDSALVPHEAMPTRRERLVVAGWLHERAAQSHS